MVALARLAVLVLSQLSSAGLAVGYPMADGRALLGRLFSSLLYKLPFDPRTS